WEVFKNLEDNDQIHAFFIQSESIFRKIEDLLQTNPDSDLQQLYQNLRQILLSYPAHLVRWWHRFFDQGFLKVKEIVAAPIDIYEHGIVVDLLEDSQMSIPQNWVTALRWLKPQRRPNDAQSDFQKRVFESLLSSIAIAPVSKENE